MLGFVGFMVLTEVSMYLTFESLAVTLHTTRFNIKILRGAHIAFICFVRISEQTATFAL
jgi:hypothetical protein